MENVDQIFDAIERRAKVVNLFLKDEKNFLLSVIDYLDFLENCRGLNAIWDVIKKTKDADLKKLLELESKVEEETDKTFEKVKDYIKQNSIVEKHLNEAIDWYDQFIKGSAKTSGGRLQGKIGNLIVLLANLSDMGQQHKDFVLQFAKVQDGSIVEWTYAEHNPEYIEEKKRTERLKLTSIWNCFEELGNLYTVFMKYEKIAQEYFDKKEYFSLMGIHEFHKEISNILEGKTTNNKYRIIHLEDVAYQINRLNNFIFDSKGAFETAKQTSKLVQEEVSSLLQPSSDLMLGSGRVIEIKNALDTYVIAVFNNKSYQITRVDFDSDPYKLLRILLERTETESDCFIEAADIEKDIDEEDKPKNDFPYLITKLNFKDRLRDLFFPTINKKRIHFKRWYSQEELIKNNITPEILESILKSLEIYMDEKNPQKSSQIPSSL